MHANKSKGFSDLLAVVALMDRDGLVTQGCGFESRLRQVLSTIEVGPLSKAPNLQLLPGRAVLAAHCSKCVCTWMG